MVFVKLMGGLGNQMFQYAAGQSLAVKHGVALLADESFLKADSGGAYTKRLPELSQFRLTLPAASTEEMKQARSLRGWRRILGRSGSPQVLQDAAGLNRAFFSARPPVYLDGYWQSEEYFKEIRDVLLEDFSPAFEFSESESRLMSEIRDCESVSVHVRRGDYVRLKDAAGFHGFPGMDYYFRAMELAGKRSPGCRFFLFSDDIEWCRTAFAGMEKVTFVELKSVHSSVDLLLMKNCRHNIIANSSYSWWGAWLNENAGKIVIAPSRWYAQKPVEPGMIYAEAWEVI